jgi:hypothetical protein
MNHPTPPSDDSLESDAVWKLLDQAAPAAPRASFADDVVRMAKLLPPQEPWWKKLLAPAPIAGFAAAAAAVVIGFSYLGSPAKGPALDGPSLAVVEPAAQADPFAAIQEIAETETLMAAADHLEAYSDQELVNLVGF